MIGWKADAESVNATITARRARSATDLFELRATVFEVSPCLADDVTEAAETLAEHAAKEPGTRLFAVMRDEACPGRFLCATVFDDVEAERRHHSSAAARRFATVLLAAGVRLESPRWTAVAGV
jgi:quinol monooxygenase YgiN